MKVREKLAKSDLQNITPESPAMAIIGKNPDRCYTRNVHTLFVPGQQFNRSNKNKLIREIKAVIIELVHNTHDRLQINLSNYLANKLHYDYTYLANIFSEEEGVSIQQFIISHRIDRVKKLLVSSKLRLTEIASKLHYSSVAHLSNQFKKVTGLTPSLYKCKRVNDALKDV